MEVKIWLIFLNFIDPLTFRLYPDPQGLGGLNGSSMYCTRMLRETLLVLG